MNFFAMFLEILCYAVLPPLLFGLAVYGCRRAFCFFVGEDSGLALIRFASVLSTPVREAGHAMMAVLFWHRLEEVRMLDLRDPDGEYGFVEHSYNPRNLFAVLGNFFFAIGPAVTGLFLTLVILLSCFNGVLAPFFGSVALLTEQGAGFSEYASATVSLLSAMLGAGGGAIVLRVLGGALLIALCLGVYITPTEILDGLAGLGVLTALLAAVVGVILLFDDGRVARLILAGFRSYATAVTALFLVVLAFALAAVALGALYGLIRTLFNIDGRRGAGEDEAI